MSIGLGTYAFFWRHSSRVTAPLGLGEMLAETAEAGVTTFQICDYPAIEAMTDYQLADIAARARDLGLTLELGVRGIREPDLARFLLIAVALDASLVRCMLYTGDDHPTLDEAGESLARAIPRFEAVGVTLALETYEQVATHDLVDLVDRIDSPNLGICLDVANTIARLEHQREVIDAAAHRVVNLHVKDFEFVRAAGLVGFELVGAALGDGLLDFDYILERVRPFEKNLSTIVEHWLPWQGDEAVTISKESAWTAQSVEVLRRAEEAHKSTG